MLTSRDAAHQIVRKLHKISDTSVILAGDHSIPGSLEFDK